MNRIIIFYKTANNTCPVEEFLDSLPAKAAKKITWVLSLIEDLHVVPSSYFKKLKGSKDIWECRIRIGSNSYRILCFFSFKNVVLTHGFTKKAQKIHEKEIKKAEFYRKDYLQRSISHE